MHVAQNRWYVVLSSAELGSRPVGARRLGQDLVFWRDGAGTVQAALDVCPHRGAALSPGRVVDGCIQCPFHGFRFDGRGACTEIPAHPGRPIPATMRLAALPVREAHELVWLWTGPDTAPEAEPPFFDLRGFTWTGSAFAEDVATHYTRAIENQLDFAHLPFVHARTIGRLVRSREVELVTEVDGDRIAAHHPGEGEQIELIAPNLWRNKTGAVYQFLAFVPVDERHMRYYVRTYQPFVRWSPLAWVVGRVSRFFNGFVFREDTPVVETQPAVETRLRMGEVLLPSDRPIIEYRRWREAHRGPWAVSPPRAAATAAEPA
jgi:phenylpropionate dioxygenase-like ring-hydroxylating dioxygenase large terminal subunit